MLDKPLKSIVEAALLAAGRALKVQEILALFDPQLFQEGELPDRDAVIKAIDELNEDYAERSIEVLKVGSGYRIQVRQGYAQYLNKLWEEKPARYSRATLETLAIIAYRQPVTRGEIEEIRGVAVSTKIIQTLQEREWVKVVGHRDVPGKPALYGTTKGFLDYFNLKSLSQLPALSELKDIDQLNAELPLDESPSLAEADSSDEQAEYESETGQAVTVPLADSDQVDEETDSETDYEALEEEVPDTVQ